MKTLTIILLSLISFSVTAQDASEIKISKKAAIQFQKLKVEYHYPELYINWTVKNVKEDGVFIIETGEEGEFTPIALKEAVGVKIDKAILYSKVITDSTFTSGNFRIRYIDKSNVWQQSPVFQIHNSQNRSSSIDHIRIKINKNGYSDETVVSFREEATKAWDDNYDAYKLFSPNQNVPSIFSRSEETYPLSINGLPTLSADQNIPLYLKYNTAGSFSLELESAFTITGLKIFLVNLKNNEYFLLEENSLHTFNAEVSENGEAPSFKLVLSLAPQVHLFNENCFNSKDGIIVIEKKGSEDLECTIFNLNATADHNGDVAIFDSIVSGNYQIVVKTNSFIFDTINCTITAPEEVKADFQVDSLFHLSGGMVTFTCQNTSENAELFKWELNNETASNELTPYLSVFEAGTYSLKLTASTNNCHSDAKKTITVLEDVTNGISDNSGPHSKLVAYYHSNGITLISDSKENFTVSVFDFTGKLLIQENRSVSENGKCFIETGSLLSGVYILKIKEGTVDRATKIIV